MWNKKRIVWFVLMIATMAVIFYFSGQDGKKSNVVGNTVAQAMNLQPENSLVDESHAKILFGLSLRKLAHVGLFGVLGFCIFGFFQSFPMAMILCFIWAVADESHQLFVPGRNAKIADLFIDAIGYLLAIVLFAVGRKIHKRFLRK